MAVELTPVLAQRVLASVLSAVETPGIICGTGGVILAAAAKERIGQTHQGSARILRGECDEIAITEEDARQIQGVRPGYNCVVIFGGRRVGSIGIQGDPSHVRGTARIAARVLQMELENAQQKEELRNRALKGLQHVSAAAEQILAGTEENRRLATAMEGATAQLQERSQSATSALRVINDLSQRANLLGLNAAIEASHAGKAGAGFTVVANEIRKLADRTQQSAVDVQSTLADWRKAFEEVAGHVVGANQISREQAEAIRSVAQELQQLEQVLVSLSEG